MGDLLDLLLRNPLLLLILGGMLLQGLGSLGAKAARKAAEERRRGKPATTPVAPQPAAEEQMPSAARPDASAPSERTEWPAATEPVAPPPPAEAPRPAIDLAGELRRAMGMDVPRPRTRPVAERPAVAPAPIQFEVVEQPPRRPLPPIPESELERSLLAPRARTPRRRRHRVDLHDPAAAIIMMEVLGPPRGLRSFEEQRR